MAFIGLKFMFKESNPIFKLKTFFAAFLTPILSLGFFAGAARAEMVNHIVISEIQIAGETVDDEFIELHNPTNQEINLENWSLKRKTKTGIEYNYYISSNIQGIIKPYGYFLIVPRARCGDNKLENCYTGAIIKDNEYTTDSYMAVNNTIALFDNNKEIIDEIAWNELQKGQSLERKALQNNTCISAQNSGENLGNGCDTGNLSDFEIRNIPNPQNSQSAAEPAIINSPAINATPTPTLNLTPEPSFSPAASILPFQINLPVAEAGTDKEAVLGENLDFDGSDSFDPAGKDLIFTWDFGDKTGAKGENVSHVYKETGEYSVILKVDNGESVGEDTVKARIIAPEFSDKIILSEMLPNPVGVDKDGEWIEIYNSGDKKINLKGWILASGAKTSGKQYVFSDDKFIEAKKYLVIKRSENGLALTNESGKASLVWPPDKILSEVAYGAAKEGKSYAFINNAWQWVDAPTPGKENSIKILAAGSKVKENTVSFADVSENSNVQKISNSEQISSNEDAATSNTAVNSLSAKNNISQLGKSESVEDFLDKLIAEKIDKAILKAKASEAVSREKVLALADKAAENGIASIDKESDCKDFCLNNESAASNNQKDARNNPWFYGDLVLSALSLFLVWRYQEIRKKLK